MFSRLRKPNMCDKFEGFNYSGFEDDSVLDRYFDFASYYGYQELNVQEPALEAPGDPLVASSVDETALALAPDRQKG